MLKIISIAIGLTALLSSCTPQGAANRANSASTGVEGTNPDGTTPTPTAPTESSLPTGVTREKVTMEFTAFTVTPVLFVRSTAENICVPFRVVVKNDNVPLEGASLLFAVNAVTPMTDKGEVLSASLKSNSLGIVEGNYCSGESEGQVVIAAELSGIIVNSEKVRVTIKPLYKLSFERSDVDAILSPTEGLGDTGAIYLNLIDSGPQDCTSVYFKLTKSNKAVADTKILFRSQIDYPAGAKFAKKLDAGKTTLDPKTNKKYLSFESFTNGSGEVAVPVCAGVFLGSVDIAASFTDEESKYYETHSPVVRIVGGLTNWINMSLMFDEINGRTLRGYFNTNSKYKLPITANVGSRSDGMPIKQYPLMVAAETGRITITDGGLIDPEKGTVDFTVQALHLVDNYPYQVYPFEDVVQAQTRCHPGKIAEWGLANSKAFVNYSDIMKNWRSTLVYYTRGQEHFNDANSNGKYDEGGDGFWDRNQNGYYDSEDVLTYDAGNDGKFDRKSEWFIDLPTPFVDTDEDKSFNPNIDILIGEKYEAPNGKRDSDTTDWKYEYLPISMGPSAYSLQHYRVDTANYLNTPATQVLPWGTYNVLGVDNNLTTTDFWATPQEVSKTAFWNFAFYAHDLCGSVLPGGTKFTMWLEESDYDGPDDDDDDDDWGTRWPSFNFISPPEDHFLEPSRRLLKQAGDGARNDASNPTVAELNFNTIDHPSKDYGYPIMGQLIIPECYSPCEGAVDPADPGHACLGWSGYFKMRVQEPALGSAIDSSSSVLQTYISIPQSNSCKCVATAVQSGMGDCECPTGTTFNKVAKACQ